MPGLGSPARLGHARQGLGGGFVKRSPSAGSPSTHRRPHLNLMRRPLLGWSSGDAREAARPPHRAARRDASRAGGRERGQVRVLRRRPGAVRREGPARRPGCQGNGRERSAHESLRARLEVRRAGPGQFNWGTSDRFIGALASRGIRAVPFVWGSPRWVASNPGRPPIDSAAHKHAWENFLKAAVDRYGPGGAYWSGAYRQRTERAPPRCRSTHGRCGTSPI